jgi:pentapeptide repeat protein
MVKESKEAELRHRLETKLRRTTRQAGLVASKGTPEPFTEGILLEHQRWLNSGGAVGKRLELHPAVWRRHDADFLDVNLNGIDFSQGSFTDIAFAFCSLRFARYRATELRRVRFICCNLENCDFGDSTLEDVSFEEGTNHRLARFEGTTLIRVQWNATFPQEQFVRPASPPAEPY